MEFNKSYSTQNKIEFLQKGLKFCFPINKNLYNRLVQNIEKKQKKGFGFK
jgi:hypothetical protein